MKYSNEIESDYEINLGNNHIWTWYKVQILVGFLAYKANECHSDLGPKQIE